jgi:hypothetical protein
MLLDRNGQVIQFETVNGGMMSTRTFWITAAILVSLVLLTSPPLLNGLAPQETTFSAFLTDLLGPEPTPTATPTPTALPSPTATATPDPFAAVPTATPPGDRGTILQLLPNPVLGNGLSTPAATAEPNRSEKRIDE